MDRQVTPPKQVTLPTWGPPPPCKQVLRRELVLTLVHWTNKFLKNYLPGKTIYLSWTSLRGRRLKGKGKGVLGKVVLGARDAFLPFPPLSNACHAG